METEWKVTQAGTNGEGNAVGFVGPVRFAEPDTVPVDLGAAQQLVEAQSEAFVATRSHQPEAMGDQYPHEPVEVPVAVEEAPVEPAHLVLLAIRVVVAPLGAAHFVTHLEHRGTNRHE